MPEYTTALFQIVSTTSSVAELESKISLPNGARQQPPAPHAYYCFETYQACKSEDPDMHIKLLRTLIENKASFLKQCIHNGDELSLFWFPGKDAPKPTVFSPASLNFLSGHNISLVINP